MNGQLKKEQNGKDAVEQQERPSAPPKRFVFDISNPQLEESSRSNTSKSLQSSSIFFPKIHDFPSPINPKEAYDTLCRYILAAYNDICSQITNVIYL